MKNEKKYTRPIAGSAFLPNLYALFGWDIQCKYRISGVKRKKGNEEILIFNLQEMEILIPNSTLEESETDSDTTVPVFDDDIAPLSANNNFVAYPEEWSDNFGSKYYQQNSTAEIIPFKEASEWNTQISATTYVPEPLSLTSPSEIAHGIKSIIKDIKQEVYNE